MFNVGKSSRKYRTNKMCDSPTEKRNLKWYYDQIFTP